MCPSPAKSQFPFLLVLSPGGQDKAARWHFLGRTLLCRNTRREVEKMAPIYWHLNAVAFDYGPFSATLICLFLAVVYVGSLYVWTKGSKG